MAVRLEMRTDVAYVAPVLRVPVENLPDAWKQRIRYGMEPAPAQNWAIWWDMDWSTVREVSVSGNVKLKDGLIHHWWWVVECGGRFDFGDLHGSPWKTEDILLLIPDLDTMASLLQDFENILIDCASQVPCFGEWDGDRSKFPGLLSWDDTRALVLRGDEVSILVRE